jgi:hypothetical protein
MEAPVNSEKIKPIMEMAELFSTIADHEVLRRKHGGACNASIKRHNGWWSIYLQSHWQPMSDWVFEEAQRRGMFRHTSGAKYVLTTRAVACALEHDKIPDLLQYF